mmetsp:Transcript_14275/g.19917  ORF Transcript_14275/g.19917 Transcript_14275/m.19917 type:complete len:101 (-) Transcript_14275:63-365(-)
MNYASKKVVLAIVNVIVVVNLILPKVKMIFDAGNLRLDIPYTPQKTIGCSAFLWTLGKMVNKNNAKAAPFSCGVNYGHSIQYDAALCVGRSAGMLHRVWA